MNYRPVFMPVGDENPNTRNVVDSTGAVKQPLVAPQLTEAMATSFLSGNNSTVALAALRNTVQPSAAQLPGLTTYLAKIQAAVDTSSVETAIAAL